METSPGSYRPKSSSALPDGQFRPVSQTAVNGVLFVAC
ncbi:hypothetical protein WQQ_09120 [Hydrocarboniphaga effusa AP103]|uniref:Uncharacterized protein n=1 Tax=Hydrocarboniphaga effusa AP103 TaxID=1172194 RepID=I8TAM0_9GAMM|nr:hypothetical protein WQQ_09120 [Hydrocarboniphaga effusa AP103]